MTVVKMVTVTQILEIAIVTINMKDLIVQVISNKTKDWALVQTAALAINQGFNVRLGWPNLF